MVITTKPMLYIFCSSQKSQLNLFVFQIAKKKLANKKLLMTTASAFNVQFRSYLSAWSEFILRAIDRDCDCIQYLQCNDADKCKSHCSARLTIASSSPSWRGRTINRNIFLFNARKRQRPEK